MLSKVEMLMICEILDIHVGSTVQVTMAALSTFVCWEKLT